MITVNCSATATGHVELYFQYLRKKPPFDDENKRQELLRKLNQIDGINLPSDSIDRRPSFSLSVLTDDEAFEQFKKIINWAIEEVNAAKY